MMRVHKSAANAALVRLTYLATLVFLALIAAGCGAARTFGRAESAARAGDWDAAGAEQIYVGDSAQYHFADDAVIGRRVAAEGERDSIDKRGGVGLPRATRH